LIDQPIIFDRSTYEIEISIDPSALKVKGRAGQGAQFRFIDLGIKAGRIGVPACSVTVQHLSKRLSDRKAHTPDASAVQARTPIRPVLAPKWKCALKGVR